jgi:hypothetical protein
MGATLWSNGRLCAHGKWSVQYGNPSCSWVGICFESTVVLKGSVDSDGNVVRPLHLMARTHLPFG